MGHKEQKSKLDVQKERLKVVFARLLESEIAILEFQLTLTNEPEHIKCIKKIINTCNKAKRIVYGIVHYEILASLYNSFVSGKESFYVMLSSTITSKNKITYWDRTQKGFKEFIVLEEQAKAQTQKELDERMKQQEMLKKAKEDGKKIEMVFENGKLKPIIVENKTN